MPGIESWINNPLGVINNIYERGGSWKTNISNYISSKFQDGQSLREIPLLNAFPVDQFPVGSLVRFRCMIQDMYDPEFYFSEYQTLNTRTQVTSMRCGMYRDGADCEVHEEVDVDCDQNVTGDRMTYYCVTVPGENQWVTQGLASESVPPAIVTREHRAKRPLDEDSMEVDDVSNGQCDVSDVKRSRPDSSDSGLSTSSQSAQTDINLPLPHLGGMACLVKVYDRTTFSINDVVELVGILSTSPVHALARDAAGGGDQPDPVDEFMAAETRARNPPSSLVPRLHVVHSRILRHINPLLPVDLQKPESQQRISDIEHSASQIRAELLSVLERALMGDKLCAEYLLCHLVSSVYQRKEMMAVGKLSLNMINVPEQSSLPSHLYKLLQLLVTKSHTMDLTVNNLNSKPLIPRKDYNENRLISGALQLSANTQLLIDETKLNAGRLDNQGVKNVAALNDVLKWQKVKYDFQYHELDFHTDIPVLVLSTGVSILTTDCSVALQPRDASWSDVEPRFESLLTELNMSPSLNRIRQYLTILQTSMYQISEDIQKVILSDFVESRQQNPNNGMSADDLHILLDLARLLTLSHGAKSLTTEFWESAKAMKAEAESRRTPNVPPPPRS